MDIFSCESEMIAANYSDENTHRWSRVLLLSGSMWGHQILITTDLNLLSQIQISIFLCFQAYYVVWYLKVSISFKLIFSWFTIASNDLWSPLFKICSLATGMPSPKTPDRSFSLSRNKKNKLETVQFKKPRNWNVIKD